MRKFPQPFFRAPRNRWFVQLSGRQINLGADRDDAFRRYHDLMGRSGSSSGLSSTPLLNSATDGDTVLALVDVSLEWCQKNKAKRTYEWYVEKTSSFARRIPRTLTVGQLKPFHVQDWVDVHPKWAPGMKRACITAVQRVFNWAVRQGRLVANPIRSLEKPPGGRRTVVLTQAEFERVLGAVSAPEFRDLLTVAWETGCRPQEIVRVESRHVDLANGRWVFPPEEAKGKRQARIVYLTAAALAVTQRLLRSTPNGPLFRNADGRPWVAQSLACAFARVQIALGRTEVTRRKLMVAEEEVLVLARDLRRRGKDRRAGKPLGEKELVGVARQRLANRLAARHGPKYCLYHFRHSWATRALERGVDAVTVAVLMGHSDTRMLTRVYQHLSQNANHLRTAVTAATSQSPERVANP